MNQAHLVGLEHARDLLIVVLRAEQRLPWNIYLASGVSSELLFNIHCLFDVYLWGSGTSSVSVLRKAGSDEVHVKPLSVLVSKEEPIPEKHRQALQARASTKINSKPSNCCRSPKLRQWDQASRKDPGRARRRQHRGTRCPWRGKPPRGPAGKHYILLLLNLLAPPPSQSLGPSLYNNIKIIII